MDYIAKVQRLLENIHAVHPHSSNKFVFACIKHLHLPLQAHSQTKHDDDKYKSTQAYCYYARLYTFLENANYVARVSL